MTIELSPPATKPAKSSEAQGAKTKPKAGAPDGKPDAGASGFMAILGSIDGAANAATDAADVGDSMPPDTASPLAGALDPNTLLLQNPQIAAAMQGVATDASVKGVDANALAASLASNGSQKGQDASLPQDGKVGVRPVRFGVGDVQESIPRDVTTSQEPATVGLQHAGAHAKGGKDSLPMLSDSASSTATNSAAATATSASDHKEAVDAKFLAALEQAKSAPAGKVAEPALAALNNRPEKSQSERASGGAKNADPTYTGTAIGVSGPDFSQNAAQPTAMAPDMQVAEQVTYWVSQNVQNAEMKLDGLGHSPVEVSISVQGNEAQIAFRSDEAMTRGVLESAGAHLKDMLQREGMVLTGVSVGTSGSGDSGAGDRRGRQSARQVAIAPLQPVVASGAARAGAATGRSVDLFV